MLLTTTTLPFGAANANTALVVYTDRSSLEATVGTVATETFAASTLGDLDPGVNFYSFFTATISANDSGYTAIVEPGVVDGTRELRARLSADFPNDPPSIDVDLFGSVLAIGADFNNTTDGDSLTLVIGSDTVQFDQHLLSGGGGFLDVISDTPVQHADISNGRQYLVGRGVRLGQRQFSCP